MSMSLCLMSVGLPVFLALLAWPPFAFDVGWLLPSLGRRLAAASTRVQGLLLFGRFCGQSPSTWSMSIGTDD